MKLTIQNFQNFQKNITYDSTSSRLPVYKISSQ